MDVGGFMKLTGVGPKIGTPAVIYLIITVIVHYLSYPLFRITENYYLLIILGVILILSGIVMLASGARKLVKSANANVLMTDGLYRIFRNPMYAAYILFIIPGIALLFNSWLVSTSVIVFFIFLQIYIKEEYNYLEEKFGEEYHKYLKNVWFKYL